MGDESRVTVTDVSMPFGSMVIFMIKWSLASIPAMIILFLMWMFIAGILGGLLSVAGR